MMWLGGVGFKTYLVDSIEDIKTWNEIAKRASNNNIYRIQLTDISYINFPFTAVTFGGSIPTAFRTPLLSVGLPIHHSQWHIYEILFCGIDAMAGDRGPGLFQLFAKWRFDLSLTSLIYVTYMCFYCFASAKRPVL